MQLVRSAQMHCSLASKFRGSSFSPSFCRLSAAFIFASSSAAKDAIPASALDLLFLVLNSFTASPEFGSRALALRRCGSRCAEDLPPGASCKGPAYEILNESQIVSYTSKHKVPGEKGEDGIKLVPFAAIGVNLTLLECAQTRATSRLAFVKLLLLQQ